MCHTLWCLNWFSQVLKGEAYATPCGAVINYFKFWSGEAHAKPYGALDDFFKF